jgi:uncharacterized membrane protein
LAKTVTYEVVTAVSEFGVNYLFVRDVVTAAGLTTFSVVIAPIVYYVHEKAWDYYEAPIASSRDPEAIAGRLGVIRHGRLSWQSAARDTWILILFAYHRPSPRPLLRRGFRVSTPLDPPA